MGWARLAGLAIVGLLLFGTIGAANAVTTVDRTALNGDFAANTIEQQGNYDPVRESVIDEIEGRMNSADLGDAGQLLAAGNGTDNRALAEDAVTDEYVREETNGNIRSLYAYLNGRDSQLDLEIDLRPLKDNLGEAYGAQIEQKDTGALVEEFGPKEGEAQVPVDATTVEQMKSGPQGYEQARLDFRVDVAFEAMTTNQKLLLIGENPIRYDSEAAKEQEVRARESEIRAELRRQLETTPDAITVDGEVIDVGSKVDQRRADAKVEVCDRTRQELNASDEIVCSSAYRGSSDDRQVDNATNAAVQLQYVVIDGLTREGYSYAAFDSDITEAESGLSEETSALATARIDEEVPDTLNARERLGDETLTQLGDAREVTSTVGLAGIGLVILALVLVGVAYLITRSIETTAEVTGIALALAGGLFLIGAVALREPAASGVRDALGGGEASEFADLVVALVKGILSTLAAQSAALLVAGVILIVLGVASNRGYLDDLRARVTGDDGASPAGAAATDEDRQPPADQSPPTDSRSEPTQEQSPPPAQEQSPPPTQDRSSPTQTQREPLRDRGGSGAEGTDNEE